ncbi:MAG: homoserine kinase [Myxococcales bacterium]|nr:homoserine kinase [Myxococcales bacterium]MCB9749345.1 homoserine kinase [Myxococcales bacterium]
MGTHGAAGPWREAFAPPTLSNIGPGFDCLGIAVEGPGDRVRARRVETPGVRLLSIEGDGGKLSRDTDKNTAAVAVAALLQRYAPRAGVELELHKGLPLGSGLGSSGASACAALIAAKAALGLDIGSHQLVDLAREGERVACGSAHPDNVTPGIIGGIVMIPTLEPLRCISLPVPKDLWFALYTPGCEVSTKHAREVLPARVRLDETVRHAARLGLLVHALHVGDLALLGEAIVDDIVEPVRAGLIPGYPDAKAAAVEAGAIACSISGAGPTTFAIAASEARAAVLLEILEESFTNAGVPGQGRVSRVSEGARLVSRPLH